MNTARRDNAEAYRAAWNKAYPDGTTLNMLEETVIAILDGMVWFDTDTKELIDTPD